MLYEGVDIIKIDSAGSLELVAYIAVTLPNLTQRFGLVTSSRSAKLQCGVRQAYRCFLMARRRGMHLLMRSFCMKSARVVGRRCGYKPFQTAEKPSSSMLMSTFVVCSAAGSAPLLNALPFVRSGQFGDLWPFLTHVQHSGTSGDTGGRRHLWFACCFPQFGHFLVLGVRARSLRPSQSRQA